MANTKIPSELIDGTLGVPGISSSADATAITIDSSERVSIGHTTANADFQVSNAGAEQLEFFAGNASNVNTIQHYNRSSSSYVENRSIANNHTWHNGGTEVARIHTDNNFGIGTASPNQDGFDANAKVLTIKSANNGEGVLELIGGGNSSGDQISVINFMSQNVNNPAGQIIALRGSADDESSITFNNSGAERMRIHSNGDVSIGTTSNGSQFHVVGDGEAVATFEGSQSTGVVINSYSGRAAIIGYDRGAAAYNDVEIRAQSATMIYLDGSTNSTGIGNDSPNSANLLHVGSSSFSGYPYRHQNGTGSYYMGHGNGSYHHHFQSGASVGFYWGSACYAQGGFSTYSDERLKENITTIDGALDKVALMNGVTFNWIDQDLRGSGKQFGVTAQNMLEVDAELPKLVEDAEASQEDIDNEELDTKFYAMDYSRLTPYFIEAIKELKTKLEAAEARITELEG